LALHRRLWRKQADLVRDLARNAPDITCGPLVVVAAGRLALAKGRPLYVSDTDHLGWQSSFDQQEALASYHARRARAVASARRDLHLWERVGAEPILAAAYDGVKPVVVPTLAPAQSAADVTRWLAGERRHENVAIVGHEPGLSRTVSWLLAGSERSFVEIKKGAALLLAFPDAVEAAGATLLWALTPSQLRGLDD